jgi:hypothetical protein
VLFVTRVPVRVPDLYHPNRIQSGRIRAGPAGADFDREIAEQRRKLAMVLRGQSLDQVGDRFPRGAGGADLVDQLLMPIPK